MAKQIKVTGENLRVLDPAAGGGILACATVERLVSRPDKPKIIVLVAYEIDLQLIPALRVVLAYLADWCFTEYGVKLITTIEIKDFVLAHAKALCLFGELIPYQTDEQGFDIIISNPTLFQDQKN